MTRRSYKARVAASKARIDLDLEDLARRNPGLSPEAFQRLARERLNIAVAPDHAAALTGR